MNKTVTINVSGIVFHIEEDAYDKLSKYLITIKSYFKDSDGRDEIMSDIESRIAEILQEKVSATKQVVLMTDIDHVISVMGQPEQFVPESESSSVHTEEKRNTASSEKAVREDSFGEAKKRVYRDPEDKILGGVCSGISTYFGIDPIWLRLAFVIIFFVWGSGLLIYILLWIIIPKAITSAQKLEMRGEPVNIDTIKKTVEEEATHLKSKLKNFESEIKEFDLKKAEPGFKTFIEKTGGFFSSLFTGTSKVISRTIGFVLIIAAFPILILAVIIFSTAPLVTMLSFGLILLFGIPLTLLIYWGFKLLLQMKTYNRFFNFSLLVLWLTGIGVSLFYGYQFARGFSVKEITSQTINLQQPKNDTLYITSKKIDEAANESSFFLDFKKKWTRSFTTNSFFIIDKNNKTVLGYPKFDIEPSENDSFSIQLVKSARGRTSKEASIKSEKINYEFSQTDSLIDLNSYFDIDKNEEWRNQQVTIIIKVPINKVVYLDENLQKIIHDVDNVTKTYDDDMVSHKWIMREEGLTCLDCNGTETSIKQFHHSSSAPAKEFEVEDFSKLEVSNYFKLHIKQGNEYKVVATGNTSELKKIQVQQSGKTIKIKMDEPWFSFNLIRNKRHSPIILEITTIDLDEIELNGAVEANIEKLKAENMNISLSGASTANMNIDANNITVDMAGACELNLKGSTNTSDMEITGASTLNATQLLAAEMDISLSGASEADINVKNKLKADVAGASSLVYKGTPQKIERSVSGVSSIKAE